MGVIAVLVGIMLPGLSGVRETGNRVVCSSNVRQVGLGLAMFADDRRGRLPSSVFLEAPGSRNGGGAEAEMMMLRLDDKIEYVSGYKWDGLGQLYGYEYLLAPKVFYCPSHRGQHPFRAYRDAWASDTGEIVSNYHFRGEGPNGSRELYKIDPETSALVTDGLRTVDDFNHKVGSNVLYADLSVRWFLDLNGSISSQLSRGDGEGGGAGSGGGTFRDVWDTLDNGTEPPG